MHILTPSHPNPTTFQNPILPGFYPDPSICRVGEDYYLVTSSFAYFPGVPIFHSKDLVHWRQIGHVLDRPSQLDLDGVDHSQGIYAPTLRYHQGVFYMITTNVTRGGHFLVTAACPEGPWSEPYWLPDAPSLFFDDDSKTYYCGNRPAPEGEKYYGNCEIWLQELDLKQMKLTGEKVSLWRGALRNAIWPEAPHIYKINGLYYLMIAEGGTDYHHAVTIARSPSITGPYEGNPANPILTHRHLGRSYPVVNTGHADLVETQNGEWWMVCLASRPYGGYYRNLGRETFLAPVIWEDGWPIVSPGTGRVEFSYPVPNLPPGPPVPIRNRDDFDRPRLDPVWNFLRTPREDFWSLQERPGYLRLKLRPEKIIDPVNPSMLARRQQHINFSAAAALEFQPGDECETAGLLLIQNNHFHFRMEVALENQQTVIRLIQCVSGLETEVAKKLGTGKIYLRVTARGQDYRFYFGSSPEAMEVLAERVDGRILSTDMAGGFVGTCIGLFACSQGNPSQNHADFDWFEYGEISEDGGK